MYDLYHGHIWPHVQRERYGIERYPPVYSWWHISIVRCADVPWARYAVGVYIVRMFEYPWYELAFCTCEIRGEVEIAESVQARQLSSFVDVFPNQIWNLIILSLLNDSGFT